MNTSTNYILWIMMNFVKIHLVKLFFSSFSLKASSTREKKKHTNFFNVQYFKIIACFFLSCGRGLKIQYRRNIVSFSQVLQKNI